MTLACRFTPRAETDLDEIAMFIGRDNPVAARRAVESLRRRCFAATTFPKAFPLRERYGAGIRVLVHGNYIVLITETADAVVVERVLHAARRVPIVR